MKGGRWLGVVVFATIVSGCVAPATQTGSSPEAQSASAAQATSFPHVDAATMLAELKRFSEAYPYRQSNTSNHQAARNDLEAHFKADGLTVIRQNFISGAFGVPVGYGGQNIIAIKWGTDRTHWVVLGAHYDVTEGAVYGTYDDGSGSILVESLAAAFANVTTNRTIAFIEFDQEERGLVGSHFFVESVLKGAFTYPITVDAMIDLDMVGITYPHPAPLVAWQNSPELKNFTTDRAKAIGIPAAKLEFRKPKGGSSDGASFIQQNISTIYFWSDWDEVYTSSGTAVPIESGYAGSYPWWHKADTYETMLAMAGDQATLTAGFQTTLNLVSPLLAYAASPSFVPENGAGQ
ncbi:MAG: M28 family metallopeptidase [Thermoplasmatota archaeon]